MKTLLALLFTTLTASAANVRLERVPEGGVQPQIASASDGTLHLVYLKGDPRGCDVRHATKKPGAATWSTPRTVNNTPASAIAAGTIRGAQIAIGQDDALHIVWNGVGDHKRQIPSPLLYTRSLDGGGTFEPQRDLRADTQALDGGTSIAASTKGEVFVVWHGAPAGAEPGEIHRRVYVLKSTDNGRSFTPPKVANADDPGVCACCSLKSFITPGGELFTLYRAARSTSQRDVVLMTSRDGGSTFQHRDVGRWAINACPMSSFSAISDGKHTRGAWEAEGKVFTAPLDAQSEALAVSGDKSRHPALAINTKGETLITWSIGTGWQKGGQLGWLVLDSSGQPTQTRGTQPGMPVWAFSAAYAEGEQFVILY
jgi:hypothetical protein